MGCGRSTMGSDSPSRTSKTDEEEEPPSPAKPPQRKCLPSQVTSFASGAPLLAQAKVSESQMDFFKILDEKIENGPDDDSQREIEGGKTTRDDAEPPKESSDRKQYFPTGKGRYSTENSIRFSTTELPEDVSDWSDQESLANEAVKEQYVFMGNLYTLTRLRSRGTAADHVDVIPAPVVDRVAGGLKVNGACQVAGMESGKLPLRPATLSLKTIIQGQNDS